MNPLLTFRGSERIRTGAPQPAKFSAFLRYLLGASRIFSQPLLVALLLAPLAALHAADFYVAPNGNDGNTGTKDRPFATLERGRDAVRLARAATPESACRIILGDGIYRCDRTLVFDLRDSAAGNATTEIVAAPGARPMLSAAAPLGGGWKPAPQDLPRLPAQARGRIWMAKVPNGWPVFRTLFQGDTPLPRARTRGFRQLKQPPAGGHAIDQRHLYLPAEAVRSIADFAQAEMVVVPVYPWVMNILPMTEVDRLTGLVRTDVPATYPLGTPNFANFPDGTVWIENVLEALDEPGEWVLDSQAGKLYLWPRDGQQPGDDVVAPRLTEIIRVEGKIDYEGPNDTPVRGLAFRGLTFTQADRWPWEPDKTGWGLQHDWEMFDRPTAMLRFRGAESCRVDECRFVSSGAAGVRLDGNVEGSVVQRNIIIACIPGQSLLFERTQPAPRSARQLAPAMLRTCAVDYNLYFNTAEPGWGKKHLDAQRRFGIEQHSVEADPQFRNPAKDDFRLAPDSPALQLGFQPIDISQVGPRVP